MWSSGLFCPAANTVLTHPARARLATSAVQPSFPSFLARCCIAQRPPEQPTRSYEPPASQRRIQQCRAYCHPMSAAAASAPSASDMVRPAVPRAASPSAVAAAGPGYTLSYGLQGRHRLLRPWRLLRAPLRRAGPPAAARLRRPFLCSAPSPTEYRRPAVEGRGVGQAGGSLRCPCAPLTTPSFASGSTPGVARRRATTGA